MENEKKLSIENISISSFIKTNDIVQNDIILFEESVFEGNFKQPIYIGERTILAKVIKESYGEKKQQHTFTLEVLDCYGKKQEEILFKRKILRKGRNLYKKNPLRLIVDDENTRQNIANEKHNRGKKARKERVIRINKKTS